MESGYQWISGYWADAALTEIEYLPEPPASVEVGPNIAAPSLDHSWLPGCWIWQQNRYAWQPGYWAPMQPDWDWVPAHYACSPRGYVFVNGYYDYSVSRRGVLFAPVYLNSGIYSQPGYSYSPSTVIDLRLFTAHLFSRPRYHHYYFGDYYANSYSTGGYFPSFSYGSSGRGYDPFYARQRWNNRDDRDWQRRIERDFANRRDHEDQRPPRTLAAMIERNRSAPESADKSLVVAMSLEQLTQNPESAQRFQTLNKDELQVLAQRRQEIQEFRNERKQLEAETTGTNPDNAVNPVEPVKVRLPKSPVVATTASASGKGTAAPKSPDAPKIDPQVVAKPRVPREEQAGRGNAAGSKNRPDSNAKPPAGKKPSEPGSKSGQRGNPKSKPGQVDPKPVAPKIDAKPGDPVVPMPDRPKVDPKPKGGKGDPKPDSPKVAPKPTKPEVTQSPSLSLTALPGDGGIRTRKIAILVADGVDTAEVSALCDALRGAGAVPWRVGLRIGPVKTANGNALDADGSLENSPAVLFDAMVLPGSDAAVKVLRRNPMVGDFIQNQYRHGKTLLGLGASRSLFETQGVRAKLPDGSADEGVLMFEDVKQALAPFMKAVGMHRHSARELIE